MLIKELFNLNESLNIKPLTYVSLSKKVGAYLDELPADAIETIKKNKDVVGLFTFSSDTQHWVSTRYSKKPGKFSDALASAAEDFKRIYDTEYVTLKVTDAKIAKLAEAVGTKFHISVYQDEDEDEKVRTELLSKEDLDNVVSKCDDFGTVSNSTLRAGKTEIQLTLVSTADADDIENEIYKILPSGYSVITSDN